MSNTKSFKSLYAKRNEEIVSLVKAGMTYSEAGRKFRITKQRVKQICDSQKVNSIKIRKQRFKAEIKEINQSIRSGSCFVDVYHQHDSATLMRYGLKPISELKRKRNEKIVKAYQKGSTAKNILTKCACGIGTLNGVYSVTSKNECQKFPNIVRNVKGVVNEDKKILKLIKDLRKNKISFPKIANVLNGLNYTTVSGKEFTATNVWLKYHQTIKRK